MEYIQLFICHFPGLTLGDAFDFKTDDNKTVVRTQEDCFEDQILYYMQKYKVITLNRIHFFILDISTNI